MRHFLVLCVVALALGSGVGCAGKKPVEPLTADWARTRSGHYWGSPLSSPRPLLNGVDLKDAMAVHIQILGLEEPMRPLLDPLAAHARLLATPEGENPFLPTAGVTQPARYGADAPAAEFVAHVTAGQEGRTIVLADFHGLLPPGVTAYQELSAKTALAHSSHRLRVAVYRPAVPTASATTQSSVQNVQLAFLMQRPRAAVAASAGEEVASPLDVAAPTRETALISQTVSGSRQTMVLLLPFAPEGTQVHALAAIIELSPVTDSTVKELARQMLADMQQAARDLAVQQAQLPAGALDPVFIASVIDAMTYGEHRRAALVYMASQTGGKLCEQSALVADDEFLGQFALSLADAMGRKNIWLRDEVGWMLDRLTFDMLARWSIKKRLTPELTGVLLAATGEAGRSPAALEQILDNMSSRRDFDNRLVAENFIALEDNSPAARVRAYDWLKKRGRDPADFDPLGEARQRRAAIETAINAMSQSGA